MPVDNHLNDLSYSTPLLQSSTIKQPVSARKRRKKDGIERVDLLLSDKLNELTWHRARFDDIWQVFNPANDDVPNATWSLSGKLLIEVVARQKKTCPHL